MIVGAPAVVVHVRRDQVLGHGFDRVDDVAVEVGVAEVQADADLGSGQIVGHRHVFLDEVDERSGPRQLVRHHFHRDLHAERLRQPLQLFDAPARGRARVLHADLGIPRLRSRHAEMRDEHRNGDAPRDVQRPLGFAHRARTRVRIRARDRERPAPAPAAEAFGNRRVNALQQQARFGQPLLQVGDRRRVVIVEMRPRREHLDQLEAMRRDLQQVIPGQPLAVVEVRRHPVLTFSHQAKHPLYRKRRNCRF